MFIKRGLSKFKVEQVYTYDTLKSFIKTASKDTQKRVLAKIDNYEPIKANPQDFLYIRNRSISAEETYGPNQNWDAFPSEELVKAHRTFINTPITVDHINTGQDSEVIGIVLDSVYVPKQLYRPSTGQLLEYHDTIAMKNDQIIGDWVENLWAIDKKRAEQHTPGLIEGILNGEITDSSMGTAVEMSKCSICGNEATDSEGYCDHIKAGKGEFHEVHGSKRVAYEKNYGLNFFEDTLIISDAFAKKAGTKASAGGEGADAGAKIMEIIASKQPKGKSILNYIKRAENFTEFSNTEDTVLVGDAPPEYVKSKEELDDEKKEKKRKEQESYNENIVDEEEATLSKTSTSLLREVSKLQKVLSIMTNKDLSYQYFKQELGKLSNVLGAERPSQRSFTRPIPMGEVVAPYSGFTKSYGNGVEYGRIMDELKSTYRDLEIDDEGTISIDELGRITEKIMDKLDIGTEFLDEVTSYITKYFGMEDMDKEATGGFRKLNCFIDKVDVQEILGALGQDTYTFTAPLTGSSEGAYGTVQFFYVEEDSSFRLNFESSEEASHAFNYLSEHYGDLFSVSCRFDIMPTIIMIGEAYEDFSTMTLLSKVKKLKGRMNQPNIDEKMESQEALRETYKFDRADQIPKGTPHYDSQDMPYTVNDASLKQSTAELHAVLGNFENKVVDAIEGLAIERGLDKSNFFYTSGTLLSDVQAAFQQDAELHESLTQANIKKTKAYRDLPNSVARITNKLAQRGWHISPTLSKVIIAGDAYNTGESINVVDKNGAPTDQGVVEEVGMMKGADGNEYPAVKINDKWYSQESHSINKNSSLKTALQTKHALRQLDTTSLFDDNVSSVDNQIPLVKTAMDFEEELSSVFTNDTRKVKQAKKLIQNRFIKKIDEIPSASNQNVISEVSLDNGNFFE